MLLCLTKIDDVPSVELSLRRICEVKGWAFACKNAPSISEISEIAPAVQVIFMNPNKSNITFTGEILRKFTNLKVLCTASTGTIHIDMDAAFHLGIHVISIKKFTEVLSTIPSTAELAFALSLDGLRKVTRSHNDVIDNNNWDFESFVGKQLKDINVGVIGYGRLGKIYARMMSDSGAALHLLDPRLSFDFSADCSRFLEKCHSFDVVALHLHAEGNEGFIGAKFFSAFSRDVVLVNTSRGEVIDHSALLYFLDRAPNAIYCTDVIPNESSVGSRNKFLGEFRSRRNVIITQHIGGMSVGARRVAFGLAVRLLSEYLGIQ